MSRPVIPTLAVLFMGWSTVAVAAETPPDAAAADPRADVQGKKNRKARPAVGAQRARRSGPARRAAGSERHPSGHGAVTHGQGGQAVQGKAGSPRGAGERPVRGTREDVSGRRPSGTTQRSTSAGPRQGVGTASGAGRPDVRGVDLPGRRGADDGPVRRGEEQPGARELPGRSAQVEDRPARAGRPDHRVSRPGAEAEGAGRGAAGSPGKGGIAGGRDGQGERVDRGRGQRGEAAGRQGGRRGQGEAARGRNGRGTVDQAPGNRGEAERGPASERKPGIRDGQQGGARDQRGGERGTAGRRNGGKPGVVRVERNRHVPDRWAPGYHRSGLGDMPRYHPQYWSSGVFLYSPPTHPHRVTVVETGGGTQTVEKNADKPLRAVDRSGSFAIGLRGGAYAGRGLDGERHADNGLGVAARYRLVEALGVEVSWARHRDTWEDASSRSTQPLAVSGQLFAFPWSRVSPYLSAGYTWTHRSSALQDAGDRVKGPHAGLGLELAIGDSAAIGLEGRYAHYGQLENLGSIGQTYQRAGALQGTLGMNFYF